MHQFSSLFRKKTLSDRSLGDSVSRRSSRRVEGPVAQTPRLGMSTNFMPKDSVKRLGPATSFPFCLGLLFGGPSEVSSPGSVRFTTRLPSWPYFLEDPNRTDSVCPIGMNSRLCGAHQHTHRVRAQVRSRDVKHGHGANLEEPARQVTGHRNSGKDQVLSIKYTTFTRSTVYTVDV